MAPEAALPALVAPSEEGGVARCGGLVIADEGDADGLATPRPTPASERGGARVVGAGGLGAAPENASHGERVDGECSGRWSAPPRARAASGCLPDADAPEPGARGGPASTSAAPHARAHASTPASPARAAHAAPRTGVAAAARGDAEPYRLVAVGHSLGGAALLMYVVTCLRAGRRHRLARLALLTPAGFVESSPLFMRPAAFALPHAIRALRWLFPSFWSGGFYLPTSLLRSALFKLTADVKTVPALSHLVKCGVRAR